MSRQGRSERAPTSPVRRAGRARGRAARARGRLRRPGAPAAALALLLILGAGVPAGAAELLRIRTWGGDEHFRVVLDLSEPAVHEDRVVGDPDRVAINLRDSRAGDLAIPETGDWMVQRIRINRLGMTVQVVLDLAGPARTKIFDLPPEGDRPARVVCDVFRPRARPKPERPPAFVVVLDPGHGGRDPGAVHRRLQEKEIVLDVARRAAARLGREPGVEVHLTRQRDTFVSLAGRARRAQQENADIFISIHVNGARSGAPRGAEVFFLSLAGASDVAARELAALENAAVTEEADPLLGEIAELPFAVDLLKTDTVRRSSLLAEAILDRLVESRLAASRGVKQANFVVLRSCRVPSALVELGFLSNPEDARQLASDGHREALAGAIAEGVLEFRDRFARRHGGAALPGGPAEAPDAGGPVSGRLNPPAPSR